MKKAAGTLLLGLLLIGCGSQQTPTAGTHHPAPNGGSGGSTFHGFDVTGQPNVLKRHVTLPPQKEMPVKLGASLRPQTSSLPAWTGPRVFKFPAFGFDINSQGAFFAEQYIYPPSGSTSTLKLDKYSSSGQLLASKEADKKMAEIETGAPGDLYINSSIEQWLVVTEDSPEKETYQIALTYGSLYYGTHTSDGQQLLTEMYGTTLNPFRAANPVYPVFLPDSAPTPNNMHLEMKAGKQGVVMSGVRPSPGVGTQVDVYEVSHQPWDEVDGITKNSLLTPKELPDAPVQTSFAVAGDGSVYVADFVSYDDNRCWFTYEGYCPSYAVLTRSHPENGHGSGVKGRASLLDAVEG